MGGKAMLGRSLSVRSQGARGVIAAFVLAAVPLLVGCSGALVGSSADPAPGQTGKSSSWTDRFSGFFASAQPKTATNGVAGPDTNIDCPVMDVRNGASTLAVNADSRDPTATALRYEVTIAKTARSCAVVDGNMRVKAGVQGRVILGPAGGPGPIEIPLRYAVVSEGVEPETITTKLFRIPVTVGADQTSVPFTHVDEDLTFPMPTKADALDSYVIYVGFDPTVEKPAPKPRAKKARKASAKRPPAPPQ